MSMRTIQQQKKERVTNYYIDQLFLASHFNSEEQHSANKMKQYTMDIKPKLSLNSTIKKMELNSFMANKLQDDQITRTDTQEINNQFKTEAETIYIPSIEERILDPPDSNKLKCRSSRGIDITHYLVQGKY